MLMINPTQVAIRFEIAGWPGQPVTQYDVAPGETVELPDAYVASGCIGNIAPGLVPAPAEPPGAGAGDAPPPGGPESPKEPVAGDTPSAHPAESSEAPTEALKDESGPPAEALDAAVQPARGPFAKAKRR